MSFGLHETAFRYDDRILSGSFSLAYEPEAGPKFEAHLGTTKDDSLIDEDLPSQRSRSLDLHLSADLSSFAQEDLALPESELKLEYRRRIDRTDNLSPDLFEPDRIAYSREALLISLAMSL